MENALHESFADLPATVQKGLERFCNRLQDALGDRLESIIVYGELAKKEQYQSRTSTANVLVVVKEVSVEVLAQIAAPLRKGVRDFRLAAMVLSEDELRSSTDVFPVKFLDMQEHHLLLCGRDVFAELPIAEDHIRLRCEQEIKNLMLRLRSFYLGRAHRMNLVERTLTTTISSFLNNLRALLLLKTGEAPVLKTAIAKTAAEEFQLDAKLLNEILALDGRKPRPKAAELKQLYNSFMATVQKAASVVDQL